MIHWNIKKNRKWQWASIENLVFLFSCKRAIYWRAWFYTACSKISNITSELWQWYWHCLFSLPGFYWLQRVNVDFNALTIIKFLSVMYQFINRCCKRHRKLNTNILTQTMKWPPFIFRLRNSCFEEYRWEK